MPVNAMREVHVEEGLNEKQREAVCHTEGPLLVLAGAGSGKTRVIVHRIAHLVDQRGVPPYNILAITFTNKAADELRERIAVLLGPSAERLWAGTFHALCSRILRENPWQKEWLKSFVIYDEADSISLIKKCLRDLRINPDLYPPESIKWRIGRLKDRLITPEGFMADGMSSPLDEKVALVYPTYQKRLREGRAFDFADLLMAAVQLLESDRDILTRYQGRFRYIMVDEYQDTNYAQFRLVQLLGGSHGNVCVVGDDDQSIYSWRGANLRNILDFEKEYPGARVVKLEENYRSTRTILGAAASVIRKNIGRKEKTLWTGRHQGEAVTYHVAEDERMEADYIRRTIQKLVSEGLNYRDMAVFYRTNAQSRVIEEALRAAGVPYQVVGDIQFYQRKEIKDLIAYLKVLANPADSVSLGRIINLPPRGIGEKTLRSLEEFSEREGLTLFDGMLKRVEGESVERGPESRLADFAFMFKEMLQEAQALSVVELLRGIITKIGYSDYLVRSDVARGLGRKENVEEFVAAAQHFVDTQPEPTLRNFLDRLSLVSEQDSYDRSMGAVSLMTLHSSKGLEFPVVFIVGMERGLCPHSRSVDDIEGMEEERRLCYVGMTRAREKLYLLRSRARSLHGILVHNPPSPFILDIPGEFMAVSGDEGAHGKVGPYRGSLARRRPAMAAPEAADGAFGRGAVVVHPKFGSGRVLSSEGEGNDLKLIVDFERHGQKKLLARYADLKEV